MAISKRELIMIRIVGLQKDVSEFMDSNFLFPTLEEIDLADLIFFITMAFLGLNDPVTMGEKVRELIASNNVTITEENLEKVVPLVIDFVHWLRAV